MKRLNLDEVGRERVAGIYAIHFKPTGKWYVGGSVDCYRRLRDHRYLMQISPAHHSMGVDVQTYGIKDVDYYLVETLPNAVEITSAEVFWVEAFSEKVDLYNKQAAGTNRYWQEMEAE